MRFWTTFAKASAFAALVHAALVAADDAAANASSDVISLTAANYDDIVNPEALILVEFFAPWWVARFLTNFSFFFVLLSLS